MVVIRASRARERAALPAAAYAPAGAVPVRHNTIVAENALYDSGRDR
jgi:hypothetical protein